MYTPYWYNAQINEYKYEYYKSIQITTNEEQRKKGGKRDRNRNRQREEATADEIR